MSVWAFYLPAATLWVVMVYFMCIIGEATKLRRQVPGHKDRAFRAILVISWTVGLLMLAFTLFVSISPETRNAETGELFRAIILIIASGAVMYVLATLLFSSDITNPQPIEGGLRHGPGWIISGSTIIYLDRGRFVFLGPGMVFFEAGRIRRQEFALPHGSGFDKVSVELRFEPSGPYEPDNYDPAVDDTFKKFVVELYELTRPTQDDLRNFANNFQPNYRVTLTTVDLRPSARISRTS